MKTIAGVACLMFLGLSACASGTVEDDPLVLDGGGVSTGSGSQTLDSGVVIITTSSAAATTSATSPAGNTSTSPPIGSDDAGFDAGLGSSDTFDAGSGFDAGSDFGEDAGSEFGFDAGGSNTGTCDGYDYPDTPSVCYCTASDPSECTANGCYGGYYCDTNTSTPKCKENLPSSCSGL